MRIQNHVLVLASLTCCVGASAEDTTLSSVISSLCSGSATMTPELSAKCDAAKMSALDQAIRASVAGPTSAQVSTADTAALKAQADLIKSTMAIDPAALAAIKPSSVNLPDMTAVALASLHQGLQESARGAAAAISRKLVDAHTNFAVCPVGPNGPRPLALVFVNQELGDLRKAYFQALDSTGSLRDNIRNASSLLAGFQAPIEVYPPAPPEAGKIVSPTQRDTDGPEQTSFTAAVAGAGLVLDLVGKGAALAASFRPVHTSSSSAVTGDLQVIAQTALIGELAGLGYHVIHTDAIVAPAPKAEPGNLRHELRGLRMDTFQLRQLAAKLSEYDYVSAANVTKITVAKIGADGKPLSKTDQQTQEQVERARLVAEAKIRQTLLNKTVEGISTLTNAAEDLNTAVFSGYPAKDQTPATPPLITAYDKWEKAQLSDRCVVTLNMKSGTAQVDKLAVQSAFGSPKYHYKVTGVQPWMLAGERGEVLVAGTMITAAGWERFGPPKD